MLSVLGVYQEGIAKSTVNEKPVHAHLYEASTPKRKEHIPLEWMPTLFHITVYLPIVTYA